MTVYYDTTTTIWRSDASAVVESLVPSARTFDLIVTIHVDEVPLRCVLSFPDACSQLGPFSRCHTALDC